MKKVISINFKGRVLPIEEAAFEQLQRYIESLRRYFANEEGRDEIINDIEDRIAELFGEELKNGVACITEEITERILAGMGRVEDFEQMDKEDGSGATFSATTATDAPPKLDEPRGSFYRNANDKVLGGVCSGLAHYLRIDPTVVRVLFALITLGGFGAGVLIYLVLWIVLPSQPLETNIRKRLFRNPDEKVVGGVASGLAAYFNIPVWVPRLVFVLPFFAGALTSIFRSAWFPFDFEPVFLTGGFGGTIVITYIVLWIVLPLAQTPTDKLQMRGEKIDVNSIKNAVQEELGGAKERVSAAGEQPAQGSPKAGDAAGGAARQFAAAATPVTTRVSRGLGHAIGVLFKAFFLFIVGIFTFAALMVLVGLSIALIATYPLKDFVLEGTLQNLALWGTLLFFLLTPVLGVFIWLIRRITGVRSKNPYLAYTFGTLWVLGWLAATVLISGFFRSFRSESFVETTLPTTQPNGNKLLVTVTEPPIRYSGTFAWMSDDSEGFDITNDTMRYANVKVRIEKAAGSAYNVKVLRYSFGNNRREAEDRAGKIVFNAAVHDSVLALGSGLAIDKNSGFRGQKVLVVVKVPEGGKIRFDESVEQQLHPFNIRVNGSYKWKRYRNEVDFDFDEYFDYETGVDYIMTADGLRKLDADGNVLPDTKNHSGNDTPSAPDAPAAPPGERYRYRPQENRKTPAAQKQIVENAFDAGTLQPLTLHVL
ncbi:MAG: PspC domain-containing protein [Lacibacter sp.]